MLYCLWLFSFLFVLNVTLANLTPSEVKFVPGYDGKLHSRQFGGYINVSETKYLYYYFVFSESSPSNDPVVLWLNGGPGCSSFDGFVYEHGPFMFSQVGNNIKLVDNPYTWAKNASMIYVDSPCGVGLSYSTNPQFDYNASDTSTANDLNIFLREFFQMFHDFQGNRFYVSGESYAGVYVPSTSQRVYEGNQNGEFPKINLVGYLVGNGVTDERFDGNAFPPFAVGKDLITIELYHEIKQTCNENYWNVTTGSACDKLLTEAYKNVEKLNIYDILEPCAVSSLTGLGRNPRRRNIGRSWPLHSQVKPGRVPTWNELLGAHYKDNVPCVDASIANKWLNNDVVRNAIYAVSVSTVKWAICTGNSNWSYTHDKGSMIPIHQGLLNAGLSVLVYSGDHHMCVPYTGSEAWTQYVGQTVKSKYRPYFSWSTPTRTSPSFPNQVAGYVRTFANNLTYCTIKGSGHTVPEYKPIEALHMFSSFINNQPL